MKQKRSRNLSDQTFQSKLFLCDQFIQNSYFEDGQSILNELYECDEHKKIIDGNTKLTYFYADFHEKFFQLSNPKAKYTKINKNLYHAYNLQAHLYKLSDNAGDELVYYTLADQVGKVMPEPLLNSAQLIGETGRHHLMPFFLNKCRKMLHLNPHFASFYELWAIHYLAHKDYELAYLCLQAMLYYDPDRTYDVYLTHKEYNFQEMDFIHKYQNHSDLLKGLQEKKIDFERTELWEKAIIESVGTE